MRVHVFVDGFNLYHRAVKKPRAPNGETYKWLDLHKLATLVLDDARYTIASIRYFTARVLALPRDPQATARQGQYLRALKTLSGLSVHYGQFKRREDWMQLVSPLDLSKLPPNQQGIRSYPDGSQSVYVHKFSEKGSDVNLASYLMLDAGSYDAAAVITNDSDLAEPIRLVRDVLKKQILVLDPCARGKFRKPSTW